MSFSAMEKNCHQPMRHLPILRQYINNEPRSRLMLHSYWSAWLNGESGLLDPWILKSWSTDSDERSEDQAHTNQCSENAGVDRTRWLLADHFPEVETRRRPAPLRAAADDSVPSGHVCVQVMCASWNAVTPRSGRRPEGASVTDLVGKRARRRRPWLARPRLAEARDRCYTGKNVAPRFAQSASRRASNSSVVIAPLA